MEKLYPISEKESGALPKDLIDLLKAFSDISKMSVSFFDAYGVFLWEHAPEYNIFDNSKNEFSVPKEILRETYLASEGNDSYIFSWKVNFVVICSAITVQGDFDGILMTSPIAVSSIDDEQCARLFNDPEISNDFPKLINVLRNLKVYNPAEIISCSLLLGNCCRSFGEKNRKLAPPAVDVYFEDAGSPKLDMENKLLENIKNGKLEKVIFYADMMLKGIFSQSKNNFSSLNIRLIELLVVLSRIRYDSKTQLNDLFESQFANLYKNILKNKNSRSLASINLDIQQLLHELTDAFAQSKRIVNSEIVTRAIGMIQNQYMEKVTLALVTENLHVNPSYFSQLFKQETGKTFTEYLNHVRIMNSKSLLKNTNLQIIEISQLVGFEDQSYFTKVFKKIAKTTPTKFRQ